MFRINLGDSDEITPMNRMRRLALLHLVMQAIHRLKLIPREDEDVVRPLRRPRVRIVDAVRPLGHEAKVVPGAPDGPEQIRMRLRRDHHCLAVGEHEPRRDDLVGGEAVLTLQPAVAAAEDDGGEAYVFADAGDWWWSVRWEALTFSWVDGPVRFPAASRASTTCLTVAPPPILAVLPSSAMLT
jgi:hypothetical protein